MGASGGSRGWWIAALVGGCGCLGIAAAIALGFFVWSASVERPFTTPPGTDEAAVREAMDVPAGATLLSITADPPHPGTFGREGLRIVALFELGPADRAAYRSSRASAAHWQPLPLPEAVFAFDAPPVELPTGIERGLGYCQTGVWTTGTSYAPHPCDPPPEQFHRYRAAVFDEDTGRLTVVFKNYY